jgi:hypothetical protein
VRKQWEDDELDLARSQTDPLADETIEEIFATRSLESVNRVLDSLADNGAPLPDDTPLVLRRYLDATRALPPWACAESLCRAHELYRLFSPQIGLGLLCGSLPEGYAAVNVANLLGLTKGMGQMASRRLHETTQFLLDVCATGAFDDHGRAVRSIQKVRLMHAAVRVFSRRHPDWRPSWGQPINQEDMLGTVMGFSIVPLDGLRRLGIRVEPSLEQGYLHLWCVAGAMLGVREDLLPHTPAEARWLMDEGRRRHYGPSEPGRRLTESVVEYIAGVLPWPATQETAKELIHFFVGSKVTVHLGLTAPRTASRTLRVLCNASRAHGRMARMGPHGRTAAARASGVVVRFSESLSRDKVTRFLIPPAERRQWTLGALFRRAPRQPLQEPLPATVNHGEHREAARIREVCEQGLQLELERCWLDTGARLTIEVALGELACVLHVNVRQARSVGNVTLLGCEFARSPAPAWQDYVGRTAPDRPTAASRS